MPTSLDLAPRHLMRSQISLIFFASLALAALQNVTVDDAVLVGAVVPEYLPSSSSWNMGPECTGCLVQPDPSKAYNGTWHDATYSPGNGFAPTVTFSFTGSGVYVFFILANTVPYATTLTNVSFLLDGADAGTYLHQPSTSTDYQYNVAVYANDTLSFGQHSLVVQPADTYTNGSNVLMLFDYLVYTTNSTDTSSSVPSSASPTSSPSQTSPATGGKVSSPNTAAIAGGVVGGVVALLLVTALLWYRRYRRPHRVSYSSEEVLEPFSSPGPVTGPAFFRDIPSPVQETSNGFANPKSASRITGSRSNAPSPPVPPSASSVVASTSSSSNPPSSAVHGLLEQVGLLREELAHLRQERTEQRNNYDPVDSLPPPEYSEYTDGEHRS